MASPIADGEFDRDDAVDALALADVVASAIAGAN